MANLEINLMFLTPGGLDGHVKIICEDGEKMKTWFERAESQLLELGCQPRTQAAPKVYQGQGKAQQGQPQRPTPIRQQAEPTGEVCPKCGSEIEEKRGQNKQTGKPWHGLFCSNRRCDFKEWLRAS